MNRNERLNEYSISSFQLLPLQLRHVASDEALKIQPLLLNSGAYSLTSITSSIDDRFVHTCDATGLVNVYDFSKIIPQISDNLSEIHTIFKQITVRDVTYFLDQHENIQYRDILSEIYMKY